MRKPPKCGAQQRLYIQTELLRAGHCGGATFAHSHKDEKKTDRQLNENTYYSLTMVDDESERNRGKQSASGDASSYSPRIEIGARINIRPKIRFPLCCSRRCLFCTNKKTNRIDNIRRKKCPSIPARWSATQQKKKKQNRNEKTK